LLFCDFLLYLFPLGNPQNAPALDKIIRGGLKRKTYENARDKQWPAFIVERD
jgi:hypothetical protein